ncbi:putative S-layer protein [Candidatus Pacearchaeota archaeon]|nr:putative S-layer protein [Candidatus Pacearchaeota archaeon]
MRSKSLSLMIAGIFLLAVALSFVSATVAFTGVSGNTTTLEYSTGAQVVTILFQAQDVDTGADTDNIDTIDFYDDNTGIMPVTLTSGVNTIVSPGTVTNAITTLADGTTSAQMSLTFTIPANKPLGNYLGTLGIDGYEPNPTIVSSTLGIQIKIQDTTKPVITITGSSLEYVALGGTYTDAGATATDNYDSTIIVTSVSTVNTAVAGTYTVIYSAQDSNLNIATQKTRTVIVYDSFCTAGSSDSNLALAVDISNKGNGDDDGWLPLDTIEIEVNFDNNRASSSGLYDINDLTFELGIFNSAGQNVAGDMIWISEDAEKFEFGDVDEGDDAKHVFEFRINPAEFSADGNYKVKIKAFPAGKEATDCISQSSDLTSFGTSKYDADVSINLPGDSEAVVVDKETLPLPATAQCEQKVSFSADVWNIGDKDFEDQIMITLFNAELGISENKTIIGDLDQGEMTQITFTFNVPADVEEKVHNLDMKTYYDWNADKSRYDEVSKDTFNFPLTVSGNCVPPALTISASLESGGKAGEPLVVKSTITNTGNEETVYTFAVSGYSDWASNAKVNNTLTLAAGASGDIWVTLDVDKKTSGDQTFNIEASSEGKLLKTQPVQVGIEGKQGLLNLSDSDSLVAILIALISAIVIAIIIVLIVRASRRK